MEENKLPIWKPIKMGDKLPCQSFLRKKNGEILKLSTVGGVKVGQDAYYLPVDDVINVIKDYPIEESEDKKMIQYFKDLAPFDKAEELYEKYGFSHKDAIAWLEKQGEKHLENYDEAEKEKADFVGDGFIECHADFLDFKEGNTYWLEYIGDDKYNVRSDNLLGKTYHITPCQLYTIFKKQTWVEKQGEQKPAWSEEDENWLINAINVCELHNYNETADWLKSLRPQSTWKPSDEQMRVLDLAIRCGINRGTTEETTLILLFNDLKKLK